GEEWARQLDALDGAMNATPSYEGGGFGVPSGPSGSEPSDAAAELFAAAAAAQSAVVSAARAAQNAAPAPGALPPGAQPSSPSDMAQAGEPASGLGDGLGIAEGAGAAGGDATGRPAAVADADWANLRRRRAEDVSAGRQSAVSEEYRDSVNAYFRTLAERAAQQSSGGSK
ncbi:MAG: hypothetical protein AAF907_06440, partial [Planctomycetota bacterium]